MVEIWIPLKSLPEEGQSLTVDDAAVWDEPFQEFGLSCTVHTPLKADLFLLAQDGGCFVRGHITGAISLPCDRCTEETMLPLNLRFETFEPVPAPEGIDDELEDSGSKHDSEVDERVVRVGDNGPEINVAALLWEEFSLALPVHPVCRTDCAGLCPTCGKNFNENSCDCTRDEGDPRLAALRGLTIKK